MVVQMVQATRVIATYIGVEFVIKTIAWYAGHPIVVMNVVWIVVANVWQHAPNALNVYVQSVQQLKNVMIARLSYATIVDMRIAEKTILKALVLGV